MLPNSPQLLYAPSKIAVAASWTPASLPGLVAWWKADAGTSTTTNGATVASWTDQSGINNTINGSDSGGAFSPIYVTAGLNGLPVLDFGTSQWMKTGSFSLGGTTLSVFAVLRATATSAGRVFGLNVSGSDNGATGGCLIFHPDTTELKTQNNAATKADTGTGILTNATWYQIGTIWDGVNSVIYVGNVSKASAANAPSFATTLTAFNVGANPSGGNPLTMRLAEMVVSTSALGSTDRSSLATYLTNKWGV